MKGMTAEHRCLILKPRATDYVKGVDSPIAFKAVVENWEPHFGFFERQLIGFETNGCVLFSTQEDFDAQIDALIADGTVPATMLTQFESMGYMDTNSRDGTSHFHSSPRFLQIQTGNGYNGNAVQDGWDTIRTYGVLPWSDLPFDATIPEETYLTGVTPEMLAKAAQFLALIGGKNTVQYHWLNDGPPKNIPQILGSLPQAPLCTGVFLLDTTWNQVTPGNPPNDPPCHCVTTYAVNGEDSNILDHYPPFEKVLGAGYPMNYNFQGVVQIIAPVEQQIVQTTEQVVSQIATDTTDTPAVKETLLQEAEEVLKEIETII